LSKKHVAVVSSVLVVVVLALGVFGGSATASPQRQLERSGPPNVVGLKLPVATERLRDAGWAAKPFNTDTLLGVILVPSHYTVCHEYAPVGHSVRLLAQKYGC
jgi:hypothetical protein